MEWSGGSQVLRESLLITAAEGLNMIDEDWAALLADLLFDTMTAFWYCHYFFGIKHLCGSSEYTAAISHRMS